MSKPRSDATELRRLRKQLKDHDTALRETRIQLQDYRARMNRAEGEVSEWKKRFDLLLKHSPIPFITGPAPLDPAPMCSTNTSTGDST